jgi:hypothetical protein
MENKEKVLKENRIRQESKEIANTILNQLKCLGTMALMSWGSRKYSVVHNGLKFQINTPRISYGWVEIILDLGSDTYNLNFYNSRMKLLSQSKEIYVDELISIIDKNIENEKYINQIKRD